MEDSYLKKILSLIILISLLVLAFFLLRPILLSIAMGIVLAFIFAPVYDWIFKTVKSKNLSLFLTCFLIILIIAIPLWFLVPIMLKESVAFFLNIQKIDFASYLKEIFPSLFASKEIASQISSFLYNFTTQTTSSLMNYLSKIIFELPTIFLHFFVVLFVFFFSIKDKDQLVAYIKNALPFSKDIEKKIFEYARDITKSVIYGHIIIGIIQGIIVGIGLFVFGVPNALLLMILTVLVGVLPFIGPFIIWGPVAAYLFFTGDKISAIGIIIFGIIASLSENFLRSVITSRKIDLHPSLIFIGMIGGLFLFGFLGLIIGPLVLAYLFLILEAYLNKKLPEIFIQKQN